MKIARRDVLIRPEGGVRGPKFRRGFVEVYLRGLGRNPIHLRHRPWQSCWMKYWIDYPTNLDLQRMLVVVVVRSTAAGMAVKKKKTRRA